MLTNINNTNIDIVHNQAHWESAKGCDSMEHLIDEAELTAVLQLQSEYLYNLNRGKHFDSLTTTAENQESQFDSDGNNDNYLQVW